MRKIEFHHNTEEQVEQYITRALNLVELLDPPTDLREAVFTQACQLYQARAIQFEQVGLGGLAIPRNNQG